jgi:hypothetical protein
MNSQAVSAETQAHAPATLTHTRREAGPREEAKAHGRLVGVPEPQLDWTD